MAGSRSVKGQRSRSRPPTSDLRPPTTRPLRSVGRRVPRKEGVARVTGAARYVDDLSFPAMLPGTTVRSTIPRGEILSIRHTLDREGFTVVDFRDIPARGDAARRASWRRRAP